MTLPPFDPELSSLALRITLDFKQTRICLDWTSGQRKVAHLVVQPEGGAISWRLSGGGAHKAWQCGWDFVLIEQSLRKLRKQFPVRQAAITCQHRSWLLASDVALAPKPAWGWLADQIYEMAGAFLSGASVAADDSLYPPEFSKFLQRDLRREEKRRLKQEQLAQRMREIELKKPRQTRAAPVPAPERAPPPPAVEWMREKPVPPIEVRIEPVRLPERPLLEARGEFGQYRLIERASQVWVSNQADDLLSLPYCAIERLEYQTRTALRVIGALRGRALLSDEVGLGKTIEAGLVLKEYLTRGMVRRFLILTVPSLIDQWAEELDSKFGIRVVTTNQPAFRTDPQSFWAAECGVLASIHVLRQENALALAQSQAWDLVIVDEAHYLRNRASKAWQAVNGLTRKFLLLLTATPVQNSIEELYSLVTLLKPGQLPSPKEFRARYVNKERPREPREPEELRQLLGQVMIRNTRANSGLRLPSRRAETVLYEPGTEERAFWVRWDEELRAALKTLPAAQASLWGRLLLQSAGSSPAAWRSALEKFPLPEVARAWREAVAPDASWERKAGALPALARSQGGVVVFTQFLATQAALAEHLREAGTPVAVLNGQTPAPRRQGIVEDFRAQGGALLLTRSGTEGRNLQFCHRLVNFDLPWNPMEIEQRIGRLHRLGQERVVEIYNLVQAGTLQEHLIEILQEKLNLFELVVGETGLVLGERFASEDFEEEIFRRWRDSEAGVGDAFEKLGDELALARAGFEEVKQLDEILFASDYESV